MKSTDITTDTTTSITRNKVLLNEYVKTDITIDINVRLEDLSTVACEDLRSAYHTLCQAIADHCSAYDQLSTAIGETRRQHMSNPGPF